MTVSVDVKGKIKRRFIVNGREYSSVEEMPGDIRRAYERAVSDIGHEGHGINPEAPQTRIVFNGREYESVDDMPEDDRRLYTAAMLTVEAQGGIGLGVTRARGPRSVALGPEAGTSALPPSMAPIEVGGGAAWPLSRLVTVGIVLLVVLGALYYLSRALLAR